MRLHFENNIFVVSRSPRGRPFAFNHLERLWFSFSLIISRRSYKETFRRGPHNVNKFGESGQVFWSCSVWKGICNFYNKIDDVFTEVSVIVRVDYEQSLFFLGPSRKTRDTQMANARARVHSHY